MSCGFDEEQFDPNIKRRHLNRIFVRQIYDTALLSSRSLRQSQQWVYLIMHLFVGVSMLSCTQCKHLEFCIYPAQKQPKLMPGQNKMDVISTTSNVKRSRMKTSCCPNEMLIGHTFTWLEIASLLVSSQPKTFRKTLKKSILGSGIIKHMQTINIYSFASTYLNIRLECVVGIFKNNIVAPFDIQIWLLARGFNIEYRKSKAYIYMADTNKLRLYDIVTRCG